MRMELDVVRGDVGNDMSDAVIFQTYRLNKRDVEFEQDILRNPNSVKCWMRYIDNYKLGPYKKVCVLYERALKQLPGSYKLWHCYLKVRRKYLKTTDNPDYEEVNNVYERALVYMNKMPRIWIEFCTFMLKQPKLTVARRLFDRALRALPITQHSRIWPLYLKFIKESHDPEVAVKIYRRYLKLFPEDSEDYIEYLTASGRLDEAAIRLSEIVNNDSFVSKHGKSKHQLWNELCNLISKNPLEIKSLNVDAIIRSGLRRYTDQLGHLWNSLADYYIRSGLFERARDIYEEAIQTVTTVRDFTQVYDAYAQFEELSLQKRMEVVHANQNSTEKDDCEIDLRMARLENLIERRLLLLNSVLLRQNPHNVKEWLKRVQLYEGNDVQVINTFTEAVETVDPQKAVGRLHTLWVEFAKFYEKAKQVEEARLVFKKAVLVSYIKVEHLASVWCEWVEMELRHDNFNEAMRLMRQATSIPSRKVAYHDDTETVQIRLHKSLKLWSLYLDMEESFGTVKSTMACYDRVIDLRIATPQTIINYGLFLEESNYFEEMFKAYEKGVALFKWPNVFDIWNTYLTKFLDRYGGTKLERARDLFEECLEGCPPQFAKCIYLLYAKLEEKHGLGRRAMAVYERATEAVLPEEKFEMFNIYIKKAAEISGIPKTREIYMKALEVLTNNNARTMYLRFAELETKLGEIDRARAIYSHCSQICDPRVTEEFWQTWTSFEVAHGNEDTLREMLRIKRSVQAMYNIQVNMMSAQMMSVISVEPEKSGMKLLEEKALENKEKPLEPIKFVLGSEQDRLPNEKVTNPDEIQFSDDEDEEDGDKENEENDDADMPTQKDVPAELFGNLGAFTEKNTE